MPGKAPNTEPPAQLTARGMTLRDYFAGQALAGLIASPEHTRHESTVLAGAAYIAADAMLVERQKS